MSAPHGPEPHAYHPAYPMSPVVTPLPMPCPPQVKAAFWLTLVGAALFVGSMAVILGASMEDLRDSAREALVRDGAAFTEQDVRSDASGTLFVLIVLAVLVTAPFVTFGALVRSPRNWVRVVLTVFVSIGCFVSFVQAALPYPHAGMLFRLMVLGVAGISIVIIVLLFGSAANRYFVR